MHRVIKPRNKWESIILKTVFVDDKTSHTLCLRNLSLLAKVRCMNVSLMLLTNLIRH